MSKKTPPESPDAVDTPDTPDTPATHSFEHAMERLESLVEEMEGGELSLDEMIAHFEEGSKLVGLCSRKLEEVEQKIEVLVKKDGKLSVEPFDDSESPQVEEAR